ncbi:MAG: hypothetical protein RJB39_773 [Candidatus Parcubacteria bacterium]|jgi:hypothetical protein
MHKKTLNIAAVCLVILLVTFIYTEKRSGAEAAKEGNIAVEGGNKIAGVVSEDEYQQKILESITKQQLESFEQVSASFKKQDSDTLSDKVAKDVFSQYIQYNTSGTLDTAAIQQMTANNFEGQDLGDAPTVTSRNLKLAASSVANLKIYTNQVAKIQVALAKSIAAVANKQNADVYIKNLYIATSNLYFRQPVPASLADYHANIINAYRQAVTGFNLLALQKKDPAKALLGVDKAKKAGEAISSNLEEIRSVARLNKVEYKKTDPAYQWINSVEDSKIIKTSTE